MEKEKNLQEAHKHSIRNRQEIENSKICGCFDCCRTFPSSEIDSWVNQGQTALCPYCGTDAVIGDASGAQLDKVFLMELNKKWF